MRYAIVTETYPPEINGVALTVQGLEQGLRARGHEVSVVRLRQDTDSTDDNELLVRGVGLPRYPGLKFGLPAPRALARLWSENTPDAIYVATEGPLGWSALRAARRLGVPAATGFHTRFDQYMRDYGFPFLQSTALRWMRRFHNGAQATLVPTRELAEFLQGNDFRHVVRLARAVDTTHFSPDKRDRRLREEWEVGEDGFAAIYVGRIAPEKNLELAVKTYREIQRVRPKARFVFVGDGPARAQLAADNPDFIFCGIRRGEELARHFASGDLFVFPSHSETFGNVTLEAMASGVPTVAFDYGAAREHLIDGEHGAAVDSDEAFIESAVRLAREDALRTSMGRAAHVAVQLLRPEQVSADFDELLAGLANARRHHANAATA
ncbi:glycosyl transferase [Pseudoxanthomonas sangjuensis]|uniref:glycosyltransferase family 4 protein n=1 Tax=Pseudoxanthomonas sangjuensis TaxID=1503750 RepID=UPI0013919A8E|nr:glycosyltransferase family 1 protein [Pseudoxanthomonas sangjuensis]KAF1707694.1 glycosyl transferase [Pseudoxanthomonas sangjuensis]